MPLEIARIPVSAASLCLALAGELTALGAANAQTTPDTSVARARSAFDFLIGNWTVVSRTDSPDLRAPSGETYSFQKTLNGAVITSIWRFNRGTAAQPDFADAVYYSGYDTGSRRWSFYYISMRSAQYWPGTLTDGRWYFTQNFTIGDTAFVQRQWWEPIDANTIARHIDNSPDSGKTWRPLTIRMRRQP
jgi:hypothetical protein